MKLIFGDPASIKLRDKCEEDNILKELRKKVRCPLCGAMNVGEFEFDRINKQIGWNFDCKPECPNSIESAEENCYEDCEVYTNYKGKFLTN